MNLPLRQGEFTVYRSYSIKSFNFYTDYEELDVGQHKVCVFDKKIKRKSQFSQEQEVSSYGRKTLKKV